MFDSYFYSVDASSETIKTGKIHARGVMPSEIKFSAPVEFGGMAGTWTPEQFLLSAVASCFVATFQAIAKASSLQFWSLNVVAEGIVDKLDGKWKFSSITVNPTLAIESEEDRDRALKVLSKTEGSCIIANSMATKVAFAPQITMARKLDAVINTVA